jgi:hypothetical protein
VATDDDDKRYEVMRELVADAFNRVGEVIRESYARTGQAPTSSDELWETAPRHSDHNPHTTDGLPAAWDITPGWYAPPERWDLIAEAEAAKHDYAKAHPSDGMWDLPTEQLYGLTAPEMSTVGLPVIGPGEWTVPARDDFAAVYAAVDPGNDDTGEWKGYKACQADAFGGYWMVNAPPIDPAFARVIVEDAMARIGMNPRGSIIKRVRRGGTGG